MVSFVQSNVRNEDMGIQIGRITESWMMYVLMEFKFAGKKKITRL